ncbi:hypothetical protein BH23THE1_BH23THE1_36030 [soil metagenome]
MLPYSNIIMKAKIGEFLSIFDNRYSFHSSASIKFIPKMMI